MTQTVASTQETSTGVGLIAEVDRVLALCMAEPRDPSVAYEIEQLQMIRTVLEDSTLESNGRFGGKIQIVIGAFAAKNIADWNPPLADALMSLDYKLRHLRSQHRQGESQAAA
jgi:hypothetical protein